MGRSRVCLWLMGLVTAVPIGALRDATAKEKDGNIVVEYAGDASRWRTRKTTEPMKRGGVPAVAFANVEWAGQPGPGHALRSDIILAYCGSFGRSTNCGRVSRGLVALTQLEDPRVDETGDAVDATTQAVRFLGELGEALVKQPVCEVEVFSGYYATFGERDSYLQLLSSGEPLVLPGVNSASKSSAHAEEFINPAFVGREPGWIACTGRAEAECAHSSLGGKRYLSSDEPVCEWSGYGCRHAVPVLYTFQSRQAKDVSWVDDVQGKNEQECIFLPNRRFLVQEAEERQNDPLATLDHADLVQWFLRAGRVDFAMWVTHGQDDGPGLLSRFERDGTADFWMYSGLENYEDNCVTAHTEACLCAEKDCLPLERLSVARVWFDGRFVLHGKPGARGGTIANSHRSYFHVLLVDAQARSLVV